MITASSLHELHEQTGRTAVVIACGVFDGVHKGHQKLLNKLTQLAEKHHALPVALTFEPHPRMVLDTYPEPPRLTTGKQKLELLAHYGARAAVVLDFNRELASLSATQFLHRYLLSTELELHGIAVGGNWRFGSGGEGDLQFLQNAGRKHGFEAVGVPEKEVDGAPVSSTRIREALLAGDLTTAATMLGCSYSVRGKVVRGRGIAKSELEYPTANVDTGELLLPPPGVYAAQVSRRPRDHTPTTAIAYVGSAPTVTGQLECPEKKLEVHLFSNDLNLYGKVLDVQFTAFIRKEKSFASLHALKQQIQEDVRTARRLSVAG
ncbi:MAG: riboflavin biosynthesis protein RibF [Lentisphaeria bacterium]